MIFLEELVKNRIIDESKIQDIYKKAEEKYGGDLDQALIDFKIDENKILEVKSRIFNIPSKEVNPKNIDSSILDLISLESAKNYQFVPIGIKDNILEVGIVNPDNIQAIDVLTFITSRINMPYKLFVIKKSLFNSIIEKYSGMNTEVGEALSDLNSDLT